MKNIFSLFFLVLLNVSMTMGQENIQRVYEISVISRPQKVELIEYENGNYTGFVITEITKGKWRRGWLNRVWKKIWNIKSKDIIDKNPIDDKVVINLMSKLKENGIETIKKCNEVEECRKYGFLDSGTAFFKIKTPKIERRYGFQSIYPLKENNKEKIELRAKAQKLITILYNHIDLKQEFSDLFKRLPKGHYHWYRASGNATITVKNRKREK